MATKKSPPGMNMAGCMPVPNVEGMSSMMAPQLKMMEAVISQNIEVLDFLKSRFERDQEMVGKLADEADPLKAMSLWGEFWQRTASDYATEMSKLATSMTSIAERAVRSATEEGEAIAKATSGK
ncbi:phasin family protein [Thioclava pacifica]|uniref:Phasin domain-containing protein n=1 Tax=Thioclava pacifica DSM 10166 TaxID=1353537 RepID=A0A074J771_9RHOB|nr:phasin family protein [Thioclava pacifica]KEO51705.1 hypothetical protein TP2_09510 [Thioclava pacifica DSM 10166]